MALSGRSLASALDGLPAVTSMFALMMSEQPVERLCVAYLDAQMRLIRVTTYPSGTMRSVGMPGKRIIEEALGHDARALILAHNHPGGDPWPSRADRQLTRRLSTLAGMLGIRLIDHLIFAGGRVESLRALSMM